MVGAGSFDVVGQQQQTVDDERRRARPPSTLSLCAASAAGPRTFRRSFVRQVRQHACLSVCLSLGKTNKLNKRIYRDVFRRRRRIVVATMSGQLAVRL